MFEFTSRRRLGLVGATGLAALAGGSVGLIQPASSPGRPTLTGGSASCAGWTSAQEFKAARVVLVGVMLPGPSSRSGGGADLLSPARIRVARYLKGHGPSIVRVQTAIQRSANGYVENSDGINPRAGQRWTIYSDFSRQPYPTSICDGSRLSPRRRRSPWPFTSVGSVTHQSPSDHVPSRATVLGISWTGARRRPVLVSNKSRVHRVAHVLAELPKELPGQCAEGLIFGPPTIKFVFRSPDNRVLATASQAAFQRYGIAWCVPTRLSVRGHTPIHLEGGSYLIAEA